MAYFPAVMQELEKKQIQSRSKDITKVNDSITATLSCVRCITTAGIKRVLEIIGSRRHPDLDIKKTSKVAKNEI